MPVGRLILQNAVCCHSWGKSFINLIFYTRDHLLCTATFIADYLLIPFIRNIYWITLFWKVMPDTWYSKQLSVQVIGFSYLCRFRLCIDLEHVSSISVTHSVLELTVQKIQEENRMLQSSFQLAGINICFRHHASQKIIGALVVQPKTCYHRAEDCACNWKRATIGQETAHATKNVLPYTKKNATLPKTCHHTAGYCAWQMHRRWHATVTHPIFAST